jgi:hypothetical protein
VLTDTATISPTDFFYLHEKVIFMCILPGFGANISSQNHVLWQLCTKISRYEIVVDYCANSNCSAVTGHISICQPWQRARAEKMAEFWNLSSKIYPCHASLWPLPNIKISHGTGHADQFKLVQYASIYPYEAVIWLKFTVSTGVLPVPINTSNI